MRISTCRTIFYISLIYALGNGVLSAGAFNIGPYLQRYVSFGGNATFEMSFHAWVSSENFPSANRCSLLKSDSHPQATFTVILFVRRVLSITGLGLIALGTGGIKPCVAAFGGDQFVKGQELWLEQFFSFFYMCINAGSTLSTAITPLLRAVHCDGQDSCFPLAFGVPAILMVVSVGEPIRSLSRNSHPNTYIAIEDRSRSQRISQSVKPFLGIYCSGVRVRTPVLSTKSTWGERHR